MNWRFILRPRCTSLMVSVVIHGILVVLMAGFMIVGGKKPSVVDVQIIRPESIHLQRESPKLATSATVNTSSFSTPAIRSDAPLQASSRIAAANADSFWSKRSSEIAEFTGDRSNGNDGDRSQATGNASFFGVPANGNRFVYVVDCSRSMQGSRWQKARAELIRSLHELESDSKFMIVFFSDECQPMPAGELQLATEENVALASEWIRSARLGWGTKPLASVQLAHLQDPDVIFFLTDGEFADRTAAFLREENSSRGPAMVNVHTIAFHSREGIKLLKRIARENSGQFRYVSADEVIAAPPVKKVVR